MAYVTHPRYGTAPGFTGLNPNPDDEDVHLHYNTNFYTAKQRADMLKYCGWAPEPREDQKHIPGTAINADLSKQTPATMPVSHYYDIERICRACRRLFIFYAREQKHWYEELGFSLDSDCVRCVPCRKNDQELKRLRKRYEELATASGLSTDEELELANTRISLMEEGIFPPTHSPKVRVFFNRFPDHPEIDRLRSRLQSIETQPRANQRMGSNG